MTTFGCHVAFILASFWIVLDPFRPRRPIWGEKLEKIYRREDGPKQVHTSNLGEARGTLEKGGVGGP